MPRTATLVLCLLLALGQGLAAAAQNATLVLESPLGCANGRDCFIQNYMDHDPGPGFQDYTCGSLGYDSHTGTDFRPLNPAALRDGVEVRAAAAGVVRAMRNDEPEPPPGRLLTPEEVTGREAGNAVVLTHPGGWETQYSHLRRGSVRVAPGQRVEVGQTLGLVGMSGRAEFPHVELAVRKDGRPVDPFRGMEGGSRCGPGNAPLWSPEALASLAYAPSAIAGVGFASEPPAKGQTLDTVRLSVLAPAVVFWVRLLGMRPGDELLLRLAGPDGKVLAEHRQTLDQAQAQRSVYIGKPRHVAPWPPGTYTGTCTLSRRGPGGELSVALSTKQTLDIR
jgi:hypothetical protein